MTYYVNDGSNDYAITLDGINKILNGLNSCKFHSGEEFSVGTEDLFLIKNDSTTIFIGYISDRTLNDDGWHSYVMTENAYTLKKRLVSSGGSYTFSISSSSTTSVVSTILSGSGWTNGSTNSTTINGVYFYYTNIWDALTKIITELSKDGTDNINMYFNSSTKTVTYGKINTDKTSAGNISYIKKDVKESDFDYNVDGIIVIGKDGSAIEGQYPSSITGDYIKVFQKKDLADSDEADQLAQTIYNKFGSVKQRIEVTLKPNHTYQEGDYVSVDSSNYIIYDVTESMDSTVLGLNSKNVTLKDLLGEDVYEISGYTYPGAYVQWDGGWQNVQGSSFDAGAINPLYNYYINDIDSIGEIKLKMEVDNYKTQTWLDNTNATLDITDDKTYLSIDRLASITKRLSTMISSQTAVTLGGSTATDYLPSSSTSYSFSNTNGYENGTVILSGYVFTFTDNPDTDKGTDLRIQIGTSTDNITFTYAEQYVPSFRYYDPSDYEHPQPLFVAIPITGSSSTNNYIRILFQVPSTSQTGFGLLAYINKAYVVYYDRHNHTTDEDYHEHTSSVTNENMDDFIIDGGYIENTYPSSLYVQIKNSTYTSWETIWTGLTGGSQKIGGDTYISSDLKSYFKDGNNSLQVLCSSSTKGSVHLFGNELNYGVQ